MSSAVETRPCVVPGCKVTINVRSRSAVCRTHMHHNKYCLCKKCQKLRNKAPLPEAETREPYKPPIPDWEGKRYE